MRFLTVTVSSIVDTRIYNIAESGVKHNKSIKSHIYIYIYINDWKSSQRMNLQDVGSETSVNDSVQTNKMINKRLKCSTTPKKDVKI